jgi:N-acetylglucosamine-6-phosphate deacetylase
MRTLLTGGRVVTPGRVLDNGWIAVTDGLIEATGEGTAHKGVDLHGQWVLPGFIDLHVHGGGGASFTDGSPDDARHAARFHREHGSTSLLASLVTAPLAELEARTAMLAGLAAEGVITGIHLEGPFLSAARCGAQDPRYMIPPGQATFERLHKAAGNHLRIITIAPELPGAIDLIKTITQQGVTAAVGHTDATAEITVAAADAGASHATHLFNGMRPWHHREPGPAGVLLDRDEVTCEIIADGVHLHDTTLRVTARAVGPRRLVLITDAMAAAGMPDGSYRLGPQQVTVSGGVARLATGAIAGSTVTMAGVVRRALAAGLPVTDVAHAASTTPARVSGIAGRTGALLPGLQADLVLCDEDFRLTAVMARGQWVSRPGLTRSTAR